MPEDFDTTPKSIGLTFSTSIEYEDLLQGFFLMHSTLEGMEETADGLLTYFIPIPEFDDQFRAELTEMLGSQPKGAITLTAAKPLEIRDWNAEWEQSIEPILISKELVITPSWKIEDAKMLGAEHLMIIDPKMSFGTGHHETTRLCIRAMGQIPLAGKTVLDIGTGSGVLALFALMRGAKSTVGIDTDSWSTMNAEENRGLNGFATHDLDIRQGELANTVRPDELFDVILGNIHRNILVSIADEIAAHVKPNTYLILSGLLIYDAEEVIKVYQSAGFRLDEQLQENEWIALLLTYAPN